MAPAPVLLAVLVTIAQGATRLRRADPAAGGTDQDCPYGYGDGCDHFWDGVSSTGSAASKEKIDPTTKATLEKLLSGIIKNLNSHPIKGLVQVRQKVSQDQAAGDEKAKVLGSFISALRRKQKGAALLGRLAGTKVDDKLAASVADVLQGPFHDPFPFNSCGGGEIDAATKEQVANILKGMIKNLSGQHRNLIQVSKAKDCPFGYGCGGGGEISPATRDQVANILKGMIKNLSGHRNLMQVSQEVHDPKNTGVKKALGSLLSTMTRIGKDSKDLVSDLVG